jgi:hypothetical protein
MASGWRRPTLVLVATAVSLWVATSGAVASQHLGPTVKVTNDLVPHPAQEQSVVVSGWSRDYRSILEQLLPNGHSYSFKDRPLARLNVDIIRSNREGAGQAHLWELYLTATVTHFNLTVSQLEARRIPAGVRVQTEVKRCWTKAGGAYRC